MKKFILLSVLALCIVFVGCSSKPAEIPVIEDVTRYSQISREDLYNLEGEPASTEDWTNKTSHGDFAVTTVSYDKNSNHYEFIIADGVVVRLSIYSEKYWNNSGDTFSYSGNKANIARAFNIDLSATSESADTGSTYTLTSVNDKISNFQVGDISGNSYGFVKVTYNPNYF